MDIDKDLLKKEYLSGDYNSFFKAASEITSFLLARKYHINPNDMEDVLQDCMVSLWEKHIDNKIDIERGNLMAFIWKNSTYKILDYEKKRKRRENIAYFVSYDEIFTDIKTFHQEGKLEDDYDYQAG